VRIPNFFEQCFLFRHELRRLSGMSFSQAAAAGQAGRVASAFLDS
jgi:hypothetical protein